jgi:hypothetical protein
MTAFDSAPPLKALAIGAGPYMPPFGRFDPKVSRDGGAKFSVVLHPPKAVSLHLFPLPSQASTNR